MHLELLLTLQATLDFKNSNYDGLKLLIHCKMQHPLNEGLTETTTRRKRDDCKL